MRLAGTKLLPMKTGRLLVVFAVIVWGCGPAGRLAAEEEGCSTDHTLPPLRLDRADKKLLADRKDPPHTAADYYFLLPAAYFGNVEDSAQRRATFIDKDSLSDTYLQAKHFFECDGGGFEVTLRVFALPAGPVVGVSSWHADPDTLLEVKRPKPGQLSSITAHRPEFWRYENGGWISAKDVKLPLLSKAEVIDQYRNRFKAHLAYPDQQKFIYLDYELPRTGNVIEVVGRENFMSEAPTWASFTFDGQGFKRMP